MHRMIITENRPVDPDNIQGSHWPTFVAAFMRIKHTTRVNDLP